MASIFRKFMGLGSVVATQARRSDWGVRQRTSSRLPAGRRLSLESLEARTLLTAAGPADEQTLAAASTAADAVSASRLIVRFDDSVELSSADAVAAQLGCTVLWDLPSIHGAVVQVDTTGGDAQTAVAAAQALWAEAPGVVYAETNSVSFLNATIPDDSRFSQLWGMNNIGQTGGVIDADIDAPEAWDLGTGSDTVVVAVIDTGVDYTHPDLAANMWHNPGEIAGNGIDDDGNGWIDDVYGIDGYNNDSDPMDDHGHGTHTSGTIGAVGDNGVGVVGVNWNVQIMALKAFSAAGTSDTVYEVTCIDYMTRMKTDYGVNVVVSNNSWGGYGYSQALYDAIEASNDAGILFVASAGNDANDNDGAWPAYPASFDLPGIVSVAATDDSDLLAYFSNYGKTSVDLGAPGVNIMSTLPGGSYGYASGTSMAAPHVTGAVALAASLVPEASPSTLKEQLLASVDPVADLASVTLTGGRLNVHDLLLRIQNDAPVLNASLGSLSLRSIQEGDTTNFGTRVVTILTSGGVSADEVISDPDVEDGKGVAVIKTDTANGSWEFTTNNGVTWNLMGNCSSGSARLLAMDATTRIRFAPNPGYNGTAAIMFRAWDQTTGSNGGLASALTTGGRTAFSKNTATASITVTPVNDAPILDTEVALSLESIDEGDIDNAGTLVSSILASGNSPAVSDLDPEDPKGIAVTGVDSTHGTWQYTTDGGTWTTIASTVSTTSALLLASDDNTKVRFVPAAGFCGTVAQGIRFRAWDQTSGVAGESVDTSTNGGHAAFSEDTSSASITVNWINDSPALVDPVDEGAPVVLAIGPIHEDPSSNAGTLVSEALAVGDAAKYPIRDPDEEFSPGPGIAVIGADTANGTWQFSTDNGVLWFAVGAVSDDSALLLPADSGSRLRFLPSPDFNTTTVDTLPSVTFRAWDRTAGVSGSTFDIAGAVEEDQTAFSAATGTIHVEVLAVNDAPIFALVEEPNQETWEEAGEQSAPLVESFAPGPDTALDELDSQHFDSFIVTPADPSLFTEDGQPAIDSTGTLTYTPAPFAHGATTVTVQVVDDGGTDNGGQDTSAAQTFTITVQWVNQAPTFVAPAPDQAVDEGDGAQAVANWAQSIAPGPNDPTQGLAFYVRVVSPTDLHKFKKPPAVSKDGTLTYELAPYEFPSGDTDSIAVSVMLQDDGGTANGGSNSSAPVVFTIDVTPLPLPPPVNGVPEAFGQQAETDANLPVALILEGDDGDGGIQTLTFAIDVYPNSALGTITAFDPDTGEVEFTPKAGAFGLADFTFTVTDDDSIDGTALTSAPVTVEIWIDPVVQVPTGRRDNTLVLHLGANDRLQLDCTTTGQKARLFDQPLGLVEKLTILGSDGKTDVLTVDFQSGGYFAFADLVFDGGVDGQSNALAFRGTSDADDFVVEGDGAMANDVAVAFQNVGQVRFDGSSGDDTYTIASLDHSVRITDSKGTDTLDFSGLDLSGVADGAGVTVNLSRSRGQMQTPIQGAEASLWLSGTIEYLVGSDGDDSLTGGSSANVIHGGLGSDLIHGNGGTDLLFGDGGDDTLYADSGLAVLLGGEGNDTLYAGKKRSILIGGTETDTLTGSSGQTVLIGGTTAYDENDVALMAILKDWGGSGSFKTRVARLRSSANPLALTTTVFDDSASDTLTGGKGYDWFLPFAGDDGDVTEGFDAKKDITG